MLMLKFKNIRLIYDTAKEMKLIDSFLIFLSSSLVVCSLMKFFISLLPSHKTRKKTKVYCWAINLSSNSFCS